MEKISVLHITPHLGGGVGKVILNYVAKATERKIFSHKLACLDYANDEAKRIASTGGIFLKDYLSKDHKTLLELIKESDIVLIHWWNHPLLYELLVKETLPPCRVIFWSHISGFYPPYIFTKPLFDYADLFVFTTPISFNATEIKNLSQTRKEKIRTIWSTGGMENVAEVKQRKHKGFNVGYLGTVDYCKLNTDFLEMSASVDIDDVKFIVVGKGNEKDKKAEKKMRKHKKRVKKLKKQLKKLDRNTFIYNSLAIDLKDSMVDYREAKLKRDLLFFP